MNKTIPGTIWWSVYCWMEHAVERGELESFWFHDDVMLRVVIGSDIRYEVGILALGVSDQAPETN